MENENNEYFDLPAIIKHGDFDVRRFAERNPVTAEAYFDLLQEFLTLTQDASYAINKFENRLGDKDAYKALDRMAKLLKDLMCRVFVSEFYSILDTYDKGNWRLGAVYAEGLEEKLGEMYLRVRAAKRHKRPEQLSPGLPLREYLALLDKEESERKLVILAVDDSPVILKSVSAVLGKEYRVLTLPKPTEIGSVLEKVTPDLFLLDYQMPEINGFELVPIIRGFPDHAETPIIFLTSVGTIDNVTAALAMGASDFIVKPFKPDILREKITRHIVRKKAF